MRGSVRLTAAALAAVLALPGSALTLAPSLYGGSMASPLETLAPPPRRTATPLPLAPEAVTAPAAAAVPVTAIPKGAEAPPAGANASVALSPDAQRLAQWIQRTGDHRGLPYLILDKRRARVWVFDEQSRAVGSTPVLLGLARGDHTVPGIGDRPLKEIKRNERTTPAGRFVIEPGENIHGEDIFWIDYDAAVSMHRVRAVSAAERRLERLASPTAADNRISYGCVNVPKAFYEGVLDPLINSRGAGIAYVLPEVKPLHQVFALGGGAGRPAR